MKKKILLTTILIGMYSYTNAQSIGSVTKAASTVAKTSTSPLNVSGVSSQIMGYLSPALKISNEQKPAVNMLVEELLNKKKSALSSAVTDKTGYASKMSGIRNLFSSKMKGILDAAQYAKMLGLLPKSASSNSPLTKLLF